MARKARTEEGPRIGTDLTNQHGSELLLRSVLIRQIRSEKTPEIEKLQAAHLAHIGSMAKAGKPVSAGPFIDGGTRRGIFIFRCSAGEARAAASEDPMVKAGRLELEFYSWTPNADVIPAAKPG